MPAYQVFVAADGSYSNEDISKMLIWQSIAATGMFVLTAIFMRNKPPTAPTADVEIQQKLRANVDNSQAVKTVVQMLRDWNEMLHQPNFLFLLASFSCILGLNWAFLAIVGQMVYPCGYDQTATGWAGFSLSFAGLAGSFFISLILRSYKNYSTITKATVVLSAATGIWCLGVNGPGNFGLLVAAWVAFGLFSGPLIPVTLEFATEMTFPIPGDNSAALLFTGVNWISLALTLGLSPLLDYPASVKCSSVVNPSAGLVLCFLVLAAIVCLPLHREYLRLDIVTLVKLVPESESMREDGVNV